MFGARTERTTQGSAMATPPDADLEATGGWLLPGSGHRASSPVRVVLGGTGGAILDGRDAKDRRLHVSRRCGKMTAINNDEEILGYNGRTWDRQVERGSPWTVPVTADEVARARNGDWRISL